MLLTLYLHSDALYLGMQVWKRRFARGYPSGCNIHCLGRNCHYIRGLNLGCKPWKWTEEKKNLVELFRPKLLPCVVVLLEVCDFLTENWECKGFLASDRPRCLTSIVEFLTEISATTKLVLKNTFFFHGRNNIDFLKNIYLLNEKLCIFIFLKVAHILHRSGFRNQKYTFLGEANWLLFGWDSLAYPSTSIVLQGCGDDYPVGEVRSHDGSNFFLTITSDHKLTAIAWFLRVNVKQRKLKKKKRKSRE